LENRSRDEKSEKSKKDAEMRKKRGKVLKALFEVQKFTGKA
jgi:hypothetical protein